MGRSGAGVWPSEIFLHGDLGSSPGSQGDCALSCHQVRAQHPKGQCLELNKESRARGPSCPEVTMRAGLPKGT